MDSKRGRAAYAAEIVRRSLRDPPEGCEHCGSGEPLQQHHWNYSRPFETEFLCGPCHAKADCLRRSYEELGLEPVPLGPDGSAVIPLEHLASGVVLERIAYISLRPDGIRW